MLAVLRNSSSKVNWRICYFPLMPKDRDNKKLVWKTEKRSTSVL